MTYINGQHSLTATRQRIFHDLQIEELQRRHEQLTQAGLKRAAKAVAEELQRAQERGYVE